MTTGIFDNLRFRIEDGGHPTTPIFYIPGSKFEF
jgi:hypothetical protein